MYSVGVLVEIMKGVSSSVPSNLDKICIILDPSEWIFSRIMTAGYLTISGLSTHYPGCQSCLSGKLNLNTAEL